MVCLPFWPENLEGRKVNPFFFPPNLDTEEMQYHSYVCAFLGMQSPRIGLILALELEGACIYIISR